MRKKTSTKRKIFRLLLIVILAFLVRHLIVSRQSATIVGVEGFSLAPDLKLPLQGNKSWLLTVEAGGKAFRGSDDRYHKGGGHFTLDFDDITLEDGPLRDVPVLAAGAGKVVDVCGSMLCRFSGSGYSVVINHSAPYNGAGYRTKYGHLKEKPLVKVGDMVTQGQMLGIIGTTGLSSGTHLHFKISYRASSSQGLKQLGELKLDSKPIEEYKVNPAGNSLDTYYYYMSTNYNPDVELKRR